MADITADSKSDFAIGLFDFACSSSCCYAFLCPNCAIAEARSNIDGSSACVNLFRLSGPATRWLVRSAYGIPGDATNDCLVSCCCVPCAASQLYQTTKAWGNPTTGGGRAFNKGDWEKVDEKCTKMDCLIALCCLPCMTGAALERSVGMPFWMATFCMTPCGAQNIIRYQNRIRGDDVVQECFMGILGACMPIVAPFLLVCACHGCVTSIIQIENQSIKRPTTSKRYLERQIATVATTGVQEHNPASGPSADASEAVVELESVSVSAK